MKIDDTDFGTFTVKVSEEDGLAWLNQSLELVKLNSAIDLAVSHAGAYGKAFVLIELSSDEQVADK